MLKQPSSLLYIPKGCHEKCPGCPHRQWPEHDSLAQKEGYLRKTLDPWATALKPIVAVSGSARWGYRKNAVLHAQHSGSWEYGLKRGDEIIPIPQCPVHHPSVNRALSILTEALPPQEHFPLAFIVASGAQYSLILKSNSMPGLEWLDDSLIRQLREKQIEGLWIHLFPSAGKKVFGKGPWHLIYGKERSRDEAGLLYGPASFHQLIPELYQKSLEKASSFLNPTQKSLLIDLYSGTGNSMRKWLANTQTIIGVEWSGEAVSCALENNPGTAVLRGLCRQRIPQLNSWLQIHEADHKDRLLYVNPPRTGLEKEIVTWIRQEYRPQRMAYLSCSAGTLKRDLLLLEKEDYVVEQLIPYDFFPQTRHVECLALLSRSES